MNAPQSTANAFERKPKGNEITTRQTVLYEDRRKRNDNNAKQRCMKTEGNKMATKPNSRFVKEDTTKWNGKEIKRPSYEEGQA